SAGLLVGAVLASLGVLAVGGLTATYFVLTHLSWHGPGPGPAVRPERAQAQVGPEQQRRFEEFRRQEAERQEEFRKEAARRQQEQRQQDARRADEQAREMARRQEEERQREARRAEEEARRDEQARQERVRRLSRPLAKVPIPVARAGSENLAAPRNPADGLN